MDRVEAKEYAQAEMQKIREAGRAVTTEDVTNIIQDLQVKDFYVTVDNTNAVIGSLSIDNGLFSYNIVGNFK